MRNTNLRLVLLLMLISTSNIFGQNNLNTSEHGTLISNYLEDQKSLFKFQDKDVEQLVVTNSYYSESTDLTQVYINQTFEGIRIFNAISSVAIKNDKIFYYANRFVTNISNKVNSTTSSF